MPVQLRESLAVIYPNLGGPKRNLPKLRQKSSVHYDWVKILQCI